MYTVVQVLYVNAVALASLSPQHRFPVESPFARRTVSM